MAIHRGSHTLTVTQQRYYEQVLPVSTDLTDRFGIGSEQKSTREQLTPMHAIPMHAIPMHAILMHASVDVTAGRGTVDCAVL